MKRITTILTFIIIIFLVGVAFYYSYSPNSEKQNIRSAASLDTSNSSESFQETAESTAAIETSIKTSSTTAVADTIGTPHTILTTAEIGDTAQNLPTLKIFISEGPTVIQENELCYYRVKAIVTGNPVPVVKFSKDDSSGAWGGNIAQVNIIKGESYNLVVTATNPSGTVTKTINLSWE